MIQPSNGGIESNGPESESRSTSDASGIIFAPSMLAADWSRAGEVVAELAEAGCEWIHFDAMDGHFVPNLSFGAMMVSALRAHSKLHFDAHLMVENPGDRIAEFLDAGADSISVHAEGNAHLHRLIYKIKDGGAQAGAVLNPATPPQWLDTILPDLDFVLVMSVNPGFGGQRFLPLATQKIAYLDQVRRERGMKFLIEVDGGVGVETAPEVVAAGADILVCGSSLLGADKSPRETVPTLRAAIAGEVEKRAAEKRAVQKRAQALAL
jgi:ribulose-phosphate 3-epimerase